MAPAWRSGGGQRNSSNGRNSGGDLHDGGEGKESMGEGEREKWRCILEAIGSAHNIYLRLNGHREGKAGPHIR
jgi:hypothetical protein